MDIQKLIRQAVNEKSYPLQLRVQEIDMRTNYRNNYNYTQCQLCESGDDVKFLLYKVFSYQYWGILFVSKIKYKDLALILVLRQKVLIFKKNILTPKSF